MIKAQFMQMWDGLETSEEIVVVMGATNRPRDVDRAILRRMPATFHIGLPTAHQRRAIFQRVMAMEAVNDNIDYIRLSQVGPKLETWRRSLGKKILMQVAFYGLIVKDSENPDS